MSDSETTYVKGQLYELNVDDLKPNPHQPRKHIDVSAIESLAASYQKTGILSPILFKRDASGDLIVVAGWRRLLAAQRLKWKTIPAVCTDGDMAEIALTENALREDLTAIELAEALYQIQMDHNYTQEEIVPLVGKATSTISEILSLNRLPEDIRDECRSDSAISRQVLVEIAKKKTDKGMRALFEKYKQKREREGEERRRGIASTVKYKSRFDAMTGFMETVKLEKLDQGRRESLKGLIEELKSAADALLEKLESAPLPEEKPVEEVKPKKTARKKSRKK